jgi:hypothetical protein
MQGFYGAPSVRVHARFCRISSFLPLPAAGDLPLKCPTFHYGIQVCMALFLSSYIHQGDYLFSVQSRGKQCTFMSLSALLTAQNIPLIDWSKQHLFF